MANTRVNFWQTPLIQLLAAFVLILAVFAWLQTPQYLPDPDGWYHTRLATMLRDEGVVTAFPWTQASLYKEIFIDHHFLYHVLLIPFVSLSSNDLAGAQLATIIFASLSVMSVVWCLWRWQVPYWGVGLLLLLTSTPLLFRLSLVKAPSLAIGVTILAFYLIAERRLGWLFFWTWFYVWFYSAWPLVVVMTVVWILVDGASEVGAGFRAVGQKFFSVSNLKLIGSVVGGVMAGIIINPYFPTNIQYLKQIFSMALVPYYTFVNVGSEWYPFNAFDLPEYLSYPLLVWLLAWLVAVFTWRKQTNLTRAAWLMAFLFLIYTLRARRQTEYFVPWMILSAGLSLRDAGLGRLTLSYLKNKFSSWLPHWLKARAVAVILFVYVIVIVPWGLAHGLRLAKALLAQGFSSQTLLGASNWLKENTPPRAKVFQSDWGTFPMLFYHNRHNYYLTGLDQTFMYEYDKEKYWQWVRVTKGETTRVYRAVKELFGADYLILEKRTPDMLVWLNRDDRFVKVYEDAEAIVYKLN